MDSIIKELLVTNAEIRCGMIDIDIKSLYCRAPLLTQQVASQGLTEFDMPTAQLIMRILIASIDEAILSRRDLTTYGEGITLSNQLYQDPVSGNLIFELIHNKSLISADYAQAARLVIYHILALGFVGKSYDKQDDRADMKRQLYQDLKLKNNHVLRQLPTRSTRKLTWPWLKTAVTALSLLFVSGYSYDIALSRIELKHIRKMTQHIEEPSHVQYR